MSRRILIVDDEEDISQIVCVYFEEFLGWIVIAAASGSEGLQIARTEALDAILLDVFMPEMDGIKVFKELQADPKTQNIPVILLTAKALQHEQRFFESLNIAGIVYKPFSVLALGQQITEILGWGEEPLKTIPNP